MAIDSVTTKNATGTTVSFQAHTDEDGLLCAASSRDTSLRTFSASAAMAAAAIDATPTDVFIIRGHASTIVRVKSVIVRSYWDAGATALVIPVRLMKHVAANTGGTSAAVTPTLFDSTDVAPDATILQYSANPTIAGGATQIADMAVGTTALLTTSTAQVDFMSTAEHGLVLRGVAQELAINLTSWAGTQTGVNLSYTVIWSEEVE